MSILWSHGPLVWKVLLAAWTVVGGAVVRMRLRRRRPEVSGAWDPWFLPTWRTLVTLVAMAGLGGVGFVTLHHVGQMGLARIDRDSVDLGEVSWAAIAAAMPGSRAEAIESMEWNLAHRDGYRAEEADAQLALAEVAHDPKARIAAALRRNDLVLAIDELARRPPSRDLTFLRILLGRYGALADDVKRSPGPAGARAIAAGDWATAGAAADARGKRCLGDLFRAFGGDIFARSRLWGEVGDPDHGCALAAALVLPHAERLEALDELARLAPTMDGDERELVQALLDTEDDRAMMQYTNRYADSYNRLDTGLAWFGRWAPPAIGGGRGRRCTILRASFARYGRDLRPELAELTAMGVRDHGLMPRWRAEDLAMDMGWLVPPTTSPDDATEPPLDQDAWAIRTGLPARDGLAVVPESCSDDAAVALADAEAGDGARLAALFGECAVSWTEAPDIEAVLPRVTAHREELAAALRTWGPDWTFTLYRGNVFAALAEIRQLRTIAALAGNRDDAERWQELLDRQAAVFADKDRLIAMILWQ